MEWQPIETAPKDGDTLDLWSPSMGRCANARWDASDANYMISVPPAFDSSEEVAVTDATHWMRVQPPTSPFG